MAAHLVLVAALILGIDVARPPRDTPPLEVTLTRLFAPRPRPAPRMVRPAVRSPASQPAPLKAAPTAPPLPPPVALPDNGPIDPRIAAAEAVRGALQGMVRCAHPNAFSLSPAERDACARQRQAMVGNVPTYTVDPADHARHDPPVASHGMAVVNHLSPRPGTDLGPLDLGPVKGVSH